MKTIPSVSVNEKRSNNKNDNKRNRYINQKVDLKNL